MFSTNPCLQELDARIPVPSPPSLNWALRTLHQLFSNVISTHLENVRVFFELPAASLDTEFPSAASIKQFHATLCRKVFAFLVNKAIQSDDEEEAPVRVAFRYGCNVTALPNKQAQLSDAIRQIMVVVFEPWLLSGVIDIELPDGTYANDDDE